MSRIRTYIAVIGDLVDSRGVRDRAALQRELRQALRGFKRPQPFGALLAAGPEITAGDEFQLLVRADEHKVPGGPIVTYLAQLTEDLQIDVAFGIGFGTLATPLRDSIAELDGSCFHRAREALEGAKHEGRWAKVVTGDNPAELDAKLMHRRQVTNAVNAILRLSGDIRRAWTERQREVVRIRRSAGLQKDIATELQVSRSVVSEVLAAARVDAVEEAERAASAFLSWIANPDAFDPGPAIEANGRHRVVKRTTSRPKSKPKSSAQRSARRAKPAKRK